MAEIKDFLNPNSMLTPGMAGGLTTSITMPLALSFGLKVPWVTLSVSALFALLIVLAIKERLSKLQRIVYFILNSLIIFSISLGTAFNLDRMPKPPDAGTPPQASTTVLQPLAQSGLDWLGVPAVHAEGSQQPIPPLPSPVRVVPSPAAPAIDGPNTKIQREMPEATPAGAKDRHRRDREYQEQLRQYQQRWSW
jgi:hypothetical protein